MNNEYMKIYMANRRTERRSKLLELAGGKCVECGETENLEFNHLDRSQKSFALSGKDLDKAWSKIMIEFEKCNLLCKPHHEEYTKQQFADGEIEPWNKGIHGDLAHGSARSYHDGCRCPRCKTAKRMYRNKECNNSDIVA